MPYVGRDLQRGNYLKLDDISSSFNGSTTTFNLTSGGNAFFPGSAFSIIVSLGGVVQEPESAFQIDRSQIIFATAPTASSDFFCIALGVALGVGVPGHNTVNNDHLAKPLSYGDYFRWDSANNRVGINTLLPSTALDVVGSATFSGNVSIGGTLTYEDVANIDAVGIITARAGIEDKTLTAGRVVYTGTGGRLVDNSALTFNPTTLGAPGLNVAGVSTFTGNADFSSGIDVTGNITATGQVFSSYATLSAVNPTLTFSDTDNNPDYTINLNSGILKITDSTNTADRIVVNSTGDVTIGNNTDTGTKVYLKNSNDDANNTNSLALDIQGAWIRIGDAILGNETYSNGIGIKFHNSGSAHHSISAQGQDLYFSTTSSNGNQLWPSSRTDSLRLTGAGAAIFADDITAGGDLYMPDKMYHVGDTDTYLHFDTNTINLHAGGTTGLSVLDASVRVPTKLGINGAAPQVPLDVIANTSGYAMAIRGRSSDNTADVRFTSNDYGSIYGQIIGGPTYLKFATGGTNRWQMDSSGHLLPNTAGAVNIGSATTEIGDVFLAYNKKIHFGDNQELEIQHTSAGGGASYVKNKTGNLTFLTTDSGEFAAQFRQHSSVDLYYDHSKKFATSGIGATVFGQLDVEGEVTASQDYPNIRPVLDFNFAATKKLKPEMTFTREGEASFHDGVGSVKFVSDNEPRFEHDIVTGECKGLMFEGAGTNYSWYSRRFDAIATASWTKVGSASITANTYTAPDGTSSGAFMADTISGATGTTFNGNVLRQQNTAGAAVKHTFSIYIKLITSTQATIYVRDGATGSTATANAIPNTRNWQRVVVTSNNALTNGTTHSYYVGNTNGDIAVWGSQIERSDYVTSYIKTNTNSNATRNTDKGVHLDGEDITDVFNQGEGTLIAEVIPTLSVTNQVIVGFYQDFGTVNRVEVRAQGTNTANARFESVVGSSSVVTNANSPHAGINNVSKYAFAFQENNYASTVNGGTVQTDTNGAFPHGTGIDSMMIGEACFNQDSSMIIKRIMYYADRLPNSQLVTLTS